MKQVLVLYAISHGHTGKLASHIAETLEGAEEPGSTPAGNVSFPGAPEYLEYDLLTRLLITMLIRRGRHPEDASQDYDSSDWGAVERFGRHVAELLPAAAAPS